MKITKHVTNPLSAGSLLILKDVTVLENVSASDEAALREYEKWGDISIEVDDPAPFIRQKIQEADGIISEEEVKPEPKKAPKPKARKASKADSDGE